MDSQIKCQINNSDLFETDRERVVYYYLCIPVFLLLRILYYLYTE